MPEARAAVDAEDNLFMLRYAGGVLWFRSRSMGPGCVGTPCFCHFGNGFKERVR